MIKTMIEWYTLDEKLPFDGEILTVNDASEILCIVEFKVASTLYLSYFEQLDWIGGKVMQMYDGEYVNITYSVKYWAYVPKIGVE